jgi:hypothetical protein
MTSRILKNILCFLYHTIGAQNPLLRTDFDVFFSSGNKKSHKYKKNAEKT